MKEKLEISCEYPVSLADVMDGIIAQTVDKFGTQLKAAWALGITPQMISRRMNRQRRKLGTKQAEEKKN
jgi:hypothetical protein